MLGGYTPHDLDCVMVLGSWRAFGLESLASLESLSDEIYNELP
jgi:hypothetical protein